jgi:hypothetical protein
MSPTDIVVRCAIPTGFGIAPDGGNLVTIDNKPARAYTFNYKEWLDLEQVTEFERRLNEENTNTDEIKPEPDAPF